MNDARFNIEAVRNINQLKIFSNDGQKTEKVFWAYLPSGFRVNTSLGTDNWFGKVFETVQDSLSGLIHLGNALGGNFTGVDIRKYMFYSGSNPLRFNVNSFLILKEDYNTDILEPLQKLMNFYLPQRGKDVWESEEWKSVVSIANTSIEKIKGVWSQKIPVIGDGLSKIYDVLNQGYDAVKEFIGPVYKVKVPAQMSNKDGKHQQVNNTVFFGRHFYFEDCIITGVDLNFPIFLVEGGRPDVIEVSLTIETARMATADMFKFDKNMQLSGEDSNWQWI